MRSNCLKGGIKGHHKILQLRERKEYLHGAPVNYKALGASRDIQEERHRNPFRKYSKLHGESLTLRQRNKQNLAAVGNKGGTESTSQANSLLLSPNTKT